MTRTTAKILSASRRTDIPAFYLEWFMKQIRLGFFDIKNPFNKKFRHIDLALTPVHSIVFWSKNYAQFIEKNAGEKLLDLGYHLYFHFTINSQSTILEPNVPELVQRLAQLETLADRFGPACIAWRFDPICFFHDRKTNAIHNNLDDFLTILETAKKLNISKCVTSFMDPYRKIDRRLKKTALNNGPDIEFVPPDMNQKIRIARRMAKQTEKANMTLALCCDSAVFEELADFDHVEQNACIDGKALGRIYGGSPETRRDYGQRAKQGCKCTQSIDVGSYEEHPCFHDCLFCYASPAMDKNRSRTLQ